MCHNLQDLRNVRQVDTDRCNSEIGDMFSAGQRKALTEAIEHMELAVDELMALTEGRKP